MVPDRLRRFAALAAPDLIVGTVLAAVFVFIRMRSTTIGPSVSPAALYAGIADLPNQYRDLTNILVRAIVGATGLGGGPDHLWWYWSIEFLATTGCLTIAAIFLRRQGASPLFVFVLYAMMLANYCFQPFYNGLFFCDMPALLFMILGLWLLQDRRWIAYCLLLPVAMLNRETAAALVLVFAFVYWDRMPRRAFLLHLAAQLAIVVAVKAALFVVYRHNPENFVSFHDRSTGIARVILNLRFLAMPAALTMFGFMWLPFLVALWRLRDPFFRRAVWVIPPFVAGMMVVGNIFEFRIFTELLPIMTMTIALGLGRRRPAEPLAAAGAGR